MSLIFKRLRVLQRFGWLSVWLSLFAEGAFAQPLPQSFHHLTEEEGLSDNRFCYFLSQDSRGFIWSSSLQGLNRYDGLRVRVYDTRDGLAEPMVSSRVLEDADGNLWFTTYRYLQKLDRLTGRFSPYQLRRPDGSTETSGYYLFHLDRRRQEVWLKAGEHIYIFGTRDTTLHDRLPYPTQANWLSIDTAADGRVERIWASPYLNADGLELFQPDSSGNWWQRYFLDGKEARSDLGPQQVWNTLPDRDSVVWVFSEDGLIRLNPERPSAARCFPIPDPSGPGCVNGLFLDDRYLLVAGKSSGLWVFDCKRLGFTGNRRHDPQVSGSLSSNKPKGLLLDREGRLWVSHNNTGIDFGLSRPSPFHDPSAGSGAVASIAEDGDGRIWVGNVNGRVRAFSSGGDLLADYPAERFNGGRLQQLWADDNGDIWCVAETACYRLATGRDWETVLDIDSLSFISIAGLPSGRRLLSTTRGIFELIEGKPAFRLVRPPAFRSFAGYEFMQLIRGSGEELLAPHGSSDLWVYREEAGRLTRTDTFQLEAIIYSGWEAVEEGVFYLGTSRGLYRWRPGERPYPALFAGRQYDPQPVYGVVIDHKGSVWMSGPLGLWNRPNDSGRLLHFGEEDGLASEQFSFFACHLASDGRIWLGHDRGLTVFHPNAVEAYPYAPRIHLEELLVNSGTWKGDTVIAEKRMLKLEYYENTLAFEMRAIGFHLPRLSTLRYRLRGYDDSWATARSGEMARFTKVPPGAYQLEVEAVNANGVAGPPTVLAVAIDPPFWQTPWFRGLAVLLAAVLVGWIIRSYVRRKLRAQQLIIERQRAQQAERNRIAEELHDDMGAGLSTISFLSQTLLEQEKDRTEHSPAGEIFRSTRQLLENMEEIIWALNTENDTLENLAGGLRRYASEYLDRHDIELRSDFPKTFPPLSVSGERRRNLLLIVKEALHNVVKYAGASNVDLRLKVRERHLEFSIADDGRGFDLEQASGKGNGLKNMRKRASDIGAALVIDTGPGGGTAIRVRVPPE